MATEIRYCQFCNAKLIKRVNEVPAKFSQRKFCNHECSSKSFRKHDLSIENSRDKKFIHPLLDEVFNLSRKNIEAKHGL
jgi:hypothetical protein